MDTLKYSRVLLKLSGEALAGVNKSGVEIETVNSISQEIAEVVGLGLELGLVIGGGNIFRGVSSSAQGMDRASADYMGMLATVMNGLALQDSLERNGLDTRLMTAINMQEVAEPYIRRRAVRHLEKKRVIICAAGTGNPYFTTDTAASLRAIEVGADLLLKGTKVEGVYSADPVSHPDAELYKRLSFDQALDDRLAVMDATAVVMCREQGLPLRVFSIYHPGAFLRIVK